MWKRPVLLYRIVRKIYIDAPADVTETRNSRCIDKMNNHEKDKYVAAMVLSGVGDALGYKNGEWEFCHSGEEIHKELEALGGIEIIKVKKPKWIVSDDTVMHLATAEALVKVGRSEDKERLYSEIAEGYKRSMHDMRDRAPGATCGMATHKLRPNVKNGYRIPFNERGGGCGAAMRAMCIGLRYPRPEELDKLIAVSIESGRMTHHHPTGYLGSLAAALFTSYAVQGVSPKQWGELLMSTLEKALKYVKSEDHEVKENVNAWSYFTDKWTAYLKDRNISDGKNEPVFPECYGIRERDKYYKSLSYAGWGGSSGHDAPMIAYDAFLSAGNNWKEVCSRSMFHSGDSDSTGVMAACWYGAMNGLDGVPPNNHKKLEYRDRLETCGEKLYKLSLPETRRPDKPKEEEEREEEEMSQESDDGTNTKSKQQTAV